MIFIVNTRQGVVYCDEKKMEEFIANGGELAEIHYQTPGNPEIVIRCHPPSEILAISFNEAAFRSLAREEIQKHGFCFKPMLAANAAYTSGGEIR